MSGLSPYLVFSEEVMAARASGKPLVALESTIISHGMPYPENLGTAQTLERLVRENGAVPATIAILNGKIHIGLETEALSQLATRDDVVKVSRRDLPAVIAGCANGATTVAATMICAELAGIKVFATGGIGGVHRGGELSMDISADLTELARTSVAVVCAGVKSILDIGRTLEYLETQGVPVIGFATQHFPAFYTRDSGHGVDVNLSTPQAVAELLRVKWALGLEGGAIVANPVPAANAMDQETIQRATDEALAEADRQGIAGKAVTPFLLDYIKQITDRASLRTNMALVENNAVLAAKIAVCLS